MALGENDGFQQTKTGFDGCDKNKCFTEDKARGRRAGRLLVVDTLHSLKKKEKKI